MCVFPTGWERLKADGSNGLLRCADEEWRDDCETGEPVYAQGFCLAGGTTVFWGTYEDSACAKPLSTREQEASGECFSEEWEGRTMSHMRSCTAAGSVTSTKYASADCTGEPVETLDETCHDMCYQDDLPHYGSGTCVRVIRISHWWKRLRKLMAHVGLLGCADDDWKDPRDDCETGVSVYGQGYCGTDGTTIFLGTYEDAACVVPAREAMEQGAAGECVSEVMADGTAMSHMRSCTASGGVASAKYASADCTGEPMNTFEETCHDICYQDDRPHYDSGACLCESG